MATNKEGTVTLRYNRDNKPTSVTYPDGSYLQYRYNTIGQRIGLSENSTGYNVSYHYDNYNRLSEVRTIGPGGAYELLKVQYDFDGKLRKRILGNNASSEHT
jgi:YD repeat-containing protein